MENMWGKGLMPILTPDFAWRGSKLSQYCFRKRLHNISYDHWQTQDSVTPALHFSSLLPHNRDKNI